MAEPRLGETGINEHHHENCVVARTAKAGGNEFYREEWDSDCRMFVTWVMSRAKRHSTGHVIPCRNSF